MASTRLHDLRADQSGLSLIELVVAVVVFTIFLAIVLSSVMGLTRATTRAEVVARASSGVLVVFQDFDHEIRYADAINFPGSDAGGNRYVEFRTPPESTVTGATMCTQWRYQPSTGTIASRQWPDTPSSTPTAWVTRLETVFDDGAGYPFKLEPAVAAGGSPMQQLVLTVDAGNATIKGTAISTRFVARNSSITSPSNSSTITPGSSDTPVCSATTRRP